MTVKITIEIENDEDIKKIRKAFKVNILLL